MEADWWGSVVSETVRGGHVRASSTGLAVGPAASRGKEIAGRAGLLPRPEGEKQTKGGKKFLFFLFSNKSKSVLNLNKTTQENKFNATALMQKHVSRPYSCII